jgi:plastocyanin
MVAAAVVLAVPSVAAAAEQHVVAVPGLYFDPSRLSVVVGDEVTWRVSDVQTHDVRADDGSFASGRLGRFGGFTTRFDRAGSWPYLCTIHPFMRGQVDAFAALLRAPAGAALAGESVRLEGRAAPGAEVTLEQRSSPGGWSAVGSTIAGRDGAFSFAVRAVDGVAYRPVTAAGAGPEVAVAVTARVDAAIAVRPGRRRARVVVRTRPPQPGLVASLQRYSRERFMWRRVAHARLDARGRARFAVRTGGGGRVRVVLSRAARGRALAVTGVVRLQDGRRVRDPYRPKPPPSAPEHA